MIKILIKSGVLLMCLQLALFPTFVWAEEGLSIDNIEQNAIENKEQRAQDNVKMAKEQGIDASFLLLFQNGTVDGQLLKIFNYIMFFLIPGFFIDFVCQKPYNDWASARPYAFFATLASFLASLAYIWADWVQYVATNDGYNRAIVEKFEDKSDMSEQHNVINQYYHNLEVSLKQRLVLLQTASALYISAVYFWHKNNTLAPVSIADYIPPNKCNPFNATKKKGFGFSNPFKSAFKVLAKVFAPISFISSVHADEISPENEISAENYMNRDDRGMAAVSGVAGFTVLNMALQGSVLSPFKYMKNFVLGRNTGLIRTKRTLDAMTKGPLRSSLWNKTKQMVSYVSAKGGNSQRTASVKGVKKNDPKTKVKVTRGNSGRAGSATTSALGVGDDLKEKMRHSHYKPVVNIIAASVVSGFIAHTILVMPKVASQRVEIKRQLGLYSETVDTKKSLKVE